MAHRAARLTACRDHAMRLSPRRSVTMLGPQTRRACSRRRSIKHCQACGGAVRYATPADDNRERATCTVCSDDPLREPAQRRRHRAGLAATRCCCAARNIEPRNGLVDPAGRLHGARRDDRRRRARARPIEEAGARVELRGPVHALIDVVRVGQVHLFYRARACSTPTSHPARRRSRRGLFAEGQVPWDEIAFRTTKLTLERYFEDRRAGAGFGVHTSPSPEPARVSGAPAAGRCRCPRTPRRPGRSIRPSVGCGWIVLPMSTASAPISMASAISPIMSPACVPTMPPPTMRVASPRRTAAW